MVEVRDLRFSYPKSPELTLRGLEFGVGPGEIFGFLGPSGAGKSTTQKILIRLLRRYEGDVAILGQDLRRWGAEYYERIGVSFEFPNHFLKLSALENLTYFAALYRGPTRRPEELLARVGLGDEGRLRVGHFSKGMKVRLNVARSLLHSPELLFWDEPTAGLDPANARRIKELAREQREAGRTLFLTTHDMSVADELCDRVAFIVDGDIRATGAPRELKLAHGERRVRVEYGDGGRIAGTEFPLAGLGENGDFLEILRTREVQTLHTLEATLEEVFLRVTGRSLS
jgi:fluoroquinolone transport system ATP-binding protein